MEEKKDLYRLQITVSEMTFFYFIFAKKKKFISFFLICAEFLPNFMDPLLE